MQVQNDKTQEELMQALQQEIEELKEENFHLRAQLENKEQVTAMIAHDLRAPLSPIINYAQMLARQTSATKDGQLLTAEQSQKKMAAIQRQTSIIISQAKRMSRQVNDLLDASSLSSGKFSLMRETCDICEIARDVAEQLRPVAPYHTLIVITPPQPVSGKWDAGRLQQALGNLLDNAIKYSDEHTTITITVSATAERVAVSVHNQGPTISPTEKSHLFLPYTRLAASRSRQGSGLGLYITKSIIEAHDGALRLEPLTDDGDQPGGTTFTFELPLTQ